MEHTVQKTHRTVEGSTPYQCKVPLTSRDTQFASTCNPFPSGRVNEVFQTRVLLDVPTIARAVLLESVTALWTRPCSGLEHRTARPLERAYVAHRGGLEVGSSHDH